ncbi:hypothetical protein VHA_001052 [Grimontia hollisae CIP 101886]|uniref:Uncharacterized protein n=1 Tax=Grimontia hollisae CIP 101886 TaxID=675812 RepID=D0I5N5_GRIHO|nr:hypothetical protein VHA_001052 [Grimontia hollisae CIP 101886]
MLTLFIASMLREWEARMLELFLENASLAQDMTTPDVSDAQPSSDAVF